MQAVRKLDRREGARVADVDLVAADVVEELLDVERVSLGAGGDQLDERGDLGLGLGCGRRNPRAAELLRLLGGERRERELREVRKLGEAETAARLAVRGRAIGDHDQHAQRPGRTRKDLEQIPRERIDPVAVLEHENDRLLGRARTQAIHQQRLEGRLANLSLERPRQLVVRDRDPQHRPEQRSTRNERGIDSRQLTLDRLPLLRLQLPIPDPEQRPPDLLPHAIARARTEGSGLTESHHNTALARPANELGHKTRLPHTRISRDPHHRPLRLLRPPQRRIQRRQLPLAPDNRELVALDERGDLGLGLGCGRRDPRADELLRLLGGERRERELRELRKLGDAETAARLAVLGRAIGDHDQHAQRPGRTRKDMKQIPRERIDPVAVLEHENDRLLGRPRTQAIRPATPRGTTCEPRPRATPSARCPGS